MSGALPADALELDAIDFRLWARDPVTGHESTEDEELAAGAWAEAVDRLTAEELAAWLGADVPRPEGVFNEAYWDRVSDDEWSGVQRVAPRPLPGVTGVAGPRLAYALDELDLASLSPAQLVEAMTGAERLARWAQGVQLAAVKAFADYSVISDEDTRDHPLAGLPGGPQTVETGFATQREIERFCSDGIGAALGTSFTAAQQLIDAAYFTAEVPAAAAMVAAGLVDVPRLKVLARELAPVGCGTPEDRAFVEEQVSQAAHATPKQLQARVRTAVMAHRPDGEDEAHRRERRSRGVWVHRKQSGMATLSAYLTADEAQLAYQALNAYAWQRHDEALRAGDGSRCDSEDGSSFDNLRADALVDVTRRLQLSQLTREAPDGPADATGSHDSAPTRAPRFSEPARVMLHLYLQASTLVGADNLPGTLLGYGPIGAAQARRLAEGAALTRLLTDPFTGEIRAVDLPSYRVPKVLRAAVRARDRSCVFPGCDVPAYDTQLDHAVPHPFSRRLAKALAVGRTSFRNLQNLCLRHHYLKTHGGWTIQSTSGSRLEWISPTGHSYRRNAEWGPPAGFLRDHDRRGPVDEPIPESLVAESDPDPPF